MANNLVALNPEIWAKALQILHKKIAIYRQVANFRGESDMKMGDVYHRVLPSSSYVETYTPGSDFTEQAIDATDQTLSIDRSKGTMIYIDDVSKIQSAYDIQGQYGRDLITNITNEMDGYFQGEVVNATSSVTDGDFGGTAGTPVTLTGSNVFEVTAKVMEKLATQNIELNNLYGVIDPVTFSVIATQVGARETSFGDDITRNGFTQNMIRYNGMDLYLSNNYTVSRTLALATDPTDGDTVTLTLTGMPKTPGYPTGTVTLTFTFVSSIGTTPGNVLISGTADGTRANLVALLNAPGTTTANGVAFTGEALTYAQLFSATNDNSANTALITRKGGQWTGADTLTAGADGFTAALNTKDLMFGRKGAVDMVVQNQPTIKISDAEKRMGIFVKAMSLYGSKTYTDGAQALVDVKLLG